MKVRLLTISSTLAGKKEVPQIRLKGNWLEKLGFTLWKKIIIEESYGKLLIRLVSIEEGDKF